MSDLISRSELLKAMDTWDKFGYDEHNRLIRIDSTNEEYVHYVRYEDMVNCVMNMQTAYDIDKVIAKLKEIKSNGRYVQGNKAGQKIGYRNAIDDLSNKICMHFSDWEYSEDDKCIKDIIELASESVEEITERLKEGGENE